MAVISTVRTLPKDGNNNVLPMAQSFTLTDATGSAQVSPIASGTSEVALVWPSHATRLYVYCTTQPGELRTVAGGASGGTAPIPSGIWFSIPGKAGDTTLIGRANATTISFCFELLSAEA